MYKPIKVGDKFGKLTVIEETKERRNRNIIYKCLCDCGNENFVYVRATSLRNGKTKSCGCYNKERIIETKSKYNDYDVCGDYVIMYTSKYEPFLVSVEDFWKVKNITWHKTNNGYLCNKSRKNSPVLIHRFIADCPNNLLVDHRDGDKTNNIRENLRIVTDEQNNMNRQISKKNTSGTTGVSYDKKRQTWVAKIGVNNKTIWLGQYNKYVDAVNARKEAEQKYFGEYSYSNSRRTNNQREGIL